VLDEQARIVAIVFAIELATALALAIPSRRCMCL
jgi:hypothetical protein